MNLAFSLLYFASTLLGQPNTAPPIKDPFNLEEPPPQAPVTDSNFIGEFFYMLLMLTLLITLVMFTSWFLKRMLNSRMEQMNASSTIKVLEKRSLSQKTHLYLIEHEGKSLLIAETPTHVVPLKFEEKS